MLRVQEQIARRRAELSQPHIAPLTAFARSLRERTGDEIPDFDPWDGGVDAQALFLFEKPGPQASSSGFISRDNDDKTAENTFNFMRSAAIPRKQTCLWNIVPGWNGTIKLKADELRSGAAALTQLLDLLEDLKVVVLVGKRAANAWLKVGNASIPTIESAHPSARNYAFSRKAWDEIPTRWSEARQFFR